MGKNYLKQILTYINKVEEIGKVTGNFDTKSLIRNYWENQGKK